jgi:hypothetical protein
MQRIIYVIATIAVISSCKKDYTCECEPAGNPSFKITSVTKAKTNKKDAEAWCKSRESFTYETNGASKTGNYGNCSLK